MYIQRAYLENIKSIGRFDLSFTEGEHAGWHVLIGENGSGKTAIARAIGAMLVGNMGFWSIRQNPDRWLKQGQENGKFGVTVTADRKFDSEEEAHNLGVRDYSRIQGEVLVRRAEDKITFNIVPAFSNRPIAIGNILDRVSTGWFSAAFGPFRRFSGGNIEWRNVYQSIPRAGAHLSLFGEDIALTEVVPWLLDLRFQELDSGKESETLKYLKVFVNNGHILPGQGELVRIGHDGIFFRDGSGNVLDLQELSDGYRSVLSLTLELIRQLIRTYGEDKVFQNIREGELSISLPGVVIIDEVDAHLHPTWQMRIGEWFTKFFPKVQFIVTTHSPLICRACGENGKVYKLPAPGSDEIGREIVDAERDRLVFGDILVAYETEVFGEGVEWGAESRRIQEEYRELVYKQRFGVTLKDVEKLRYERLKQIFQSHVEAD